MNRLRLTLLTALMVAAAATACSSSSTGPEVITLFVAPQQVDCVGLEPRKCIQVREDPDEEWRIFYDGIEGFDFEAGFSYVLRVERRRVEDPPADGSSFRYVLLEVVSKEPE